MKTAHGGGKIWCKAVNRFDSQFLAMFISRCRQSGFAHDAINIQDSAMKIVLSTATGRMDNSKQWKRSSRTSDAVPASKTEESPDETCDGTKLSVKSGRRTHIRSAYVDKPDAPFVDTCSDGSGS